MELKEEREGSALVVSVGGRIDSNNAKSFEEQFLGFIKAGNPSVVLDMSALDYISSAGLRVILMGAKQQGAAEGKLALTGMSDHIREVFEISGFAKILTILPTRAEAVAAV